MKNLFNLTIILIVGIFIVLGCSNANNSSAPTPTPSPKLSTTPAYTKNQLKIDSAILGKDYPFTTESGVLECKPNKEIVFIANNKTYAVNGTAKANKLYASIDEIWADDPSIKGAKKSIGDVIERGMNLCS